MGWIYWLVISQINSTAEVGQASKIISLVFLISFIVQLGLEFPLLKKSSKNRKNILGTMLSIELILTLASIPILLYVIHDVYQETLEEYSFLAIGFLLANQVAFFSRYALLGISEVKDILIIDTIGMAIRFLTVLILMSAELGSSIILGSFFLQYFLVALLTLGMAKKKKFGFRTGSIQYAKKLFKDGLINSPSKYSFMVVMDISNMPTSIS